MQLDQCILGDCIECLKLLDDDSISLVVTSPPYVEGQRTCYNSVYDVIALRNILFQKMKPGGIIVWNEQDGTIDGCKSLTSFQHCMDFCAEGYFNCFEHVIYHKNGRPGPWWNQRFRVDHEYLFIWMKGNKPSYFNKKHMDQKCQAKKMKAGNTIRSSDGKLTEVKHHTTADTKSQGTIFFYNTSTAESFLHKDSKLLHPATMPEKLPEDFIKCFTQEGDLVVDVFAGSGTVLRGAKRLNRRFLGFELSAEYHALCNKLLKTIKPKL